MAATLARYLTGGGGAANPSSQETNAGAGAQAQQQQHVPATEAEMQQSAGAAGLNVRLQVLPDGARVVTRGAEGVAVAHVGAHTSTGRRASNEDRHAFAEPLTSLAAGSAAGARWLAHATFVGVYDGHGGAQCSQFLKEELGGALVEELLRGGGATALPASPDAEAGPTAAELRAALERAFLRIDAAFLKMAEGSSCRAGTTAVVAVVTHSALAVAHVGDSRALAVYSDRSSEFLTTDHKPNNPAEFARIEAAGGEVVKRGPVWRVSTKGASSWQSRCRAGRVAFTEQPPVLLAVSRAFGNKDLKRPLEIVTARPEVRLWAMGGEDDAPTAAVVLCSDGVWDVLSASDVAGHVFKALDKAGERCVSAARDAAAGVCAAAESRGSMDNVTAAVCLLGV